MTTIQAIPEFTDAEVSELAKLVHSLTGITLGKNPKQMLQMRLRTRFREIKCANVEEYLLYLQVHKDEKQLFINAVTTNETYFFRTARIWENLEKSYLPLWIEQNPNTVFHAWSAASSSGEEAYSLAIVLEAFRLKHPSFSYKILGTDISEKALMKAKAGEYTGRSIENLHKDRPESLFAYFNSVGVDLYQVKTEIKKKIEFRKHNLFEIPTNSEKFDLILLRNVLIYFNEEDQMKVLSQISKLAKETTILAIGESESLHHLKTDFTYKSHLFYQYTTSKLKVA